MCVTGGTCRNTGSLMSVTGGNISNLMCVCVCEGGDKVYLTVGMDENIWNTV